MRGHMTGWVAAVACLLGIVEFGWARPIPPTVRFAPRPVNTGFRTFVPRTVPGRSVITPGGSIITPKVTLPSGITVWPSIRPSTPATTFAFRANHFAHDYWRHNYWNLYYNSLLNPYWGYGAGYYPYYGYSYAVPNGISGPYGSSSYAVNPYAPVTPYATTPASYPPPSTAAGTNTAQVTVRVPVFDADVWFNGTKSPSRGWTRMFTSPPLSPGSKYEFTVRARWVDNGQAATIERRVSLTAGDQVLVDFKE